MFVYGMLIIEVFYNSKKSANGTEYKTRGLIRSTLIKSFTQKRKNN